MRNGGAAYRDEDRIRHMLKAVHRIKGQLGGLTRDSLHDDDNVTDVIVYHIQIIGEAANNLSDDFCRTHSEIDFKGWAGMRHRLVHDYAEIDYDIVWDAVSTDLPVLEKQLSALVKTFPEEPKIPANLEQFL